jgi:VWFA-related protein
MNCLAQSEPPQPSFKTEAAEVVVDVIVTDRKAHHVPGLTAADFKLFEDNTPQTISLFTAPAARAGRQQAGDGRAAAIANPATQPAAPEQAPAPQFITLVMDLGDLHQENLKRACDAASKFAEKTIASGNRIAIYWVDSRLRLGVPFTQDTQKALDLLKRLSARASSGRFTARDRERTEDEIDDLFTNVYPETLQGGPPLAKNLDSNGGGKGSRPTPEQQMQMETQQEQMRELNMLRSWLTIASSLQARAVFVALRAMAVAYRELPGRKSVVVFSEGFLHTPGAEAEMQAVIDAANRANVAIYVIDASGASTGMSAETRVAGGRRGGPRSTEDFSILGPNARSGGLNQFDWLQTMGSDLNGDLGLVATGTGGFLVNNSNDLGPALDRVVDDASEFYTLVYHPSNRSYDGGFRKIKVELADRGYHLRYRQGYWAIPPGREIMMTPAAAQLLASVESGEHKSSFTPQLNAAMVLAPDGHFGVSVAVSMPGKQVPFEKIKDQFLAGVSMLLIARDAQGQVLAIHERYGDVRLKKNERDGFSAKIFNMQGHVPVPELEPVSVQAIVRFADGAIGVSERKPIDPVPNSSNLRLTSLVLSDREEDAECSVDPMDPLCVRGVRILLPAQPEFARATRLVVYFSVSGLSLNDAQKPVLGLLFRLGSGAKLDPFKPEKIQAIPGKVPGAWLVLATFDLQAVPAGKYTLEMTAGDKIQDTIVSERAEFKLQ